MKWKRCRGRESSFAFDTVVLQVDLRSAGRTPAVVTFSSEQVRTFAQQILQAVNRFAQLRSMRTAAFKALLALVAFPLMAFPAFADVVIGSSPEGNGGLAPCDSDFAQYTAEVDRPIDRLVHGHVIAAYTEQPSFTPEWGARIIVDSGRYRLLVARFKASVWYSAYREIRPHRFERDLALPPPDLAVDEIALSDDTAARLAAIITHEVDSQQAANKQMGLDGESHTFRDMHGHCASAWSPDADTRAFALVDVFHSLQFTAQA